MFTFLMLLICFFPFVVMIGPEVEVLIEPISLLFFYDIPVSRLTTGEQYDHHLSVKERERECKITYTHTHTQTLSLSLSLSFSPRGI